jgi:hypothetical protein
MKMGALSRRVNAARQIIADGGAVDHGIQFTVRHSLTHEISQIVKCAIAQHSPAI